VSSLKLYEQKAPAPNVITVRIVRNDVPPSNPDRVERDFGKTRLNK
jgi:hypothetical protein